jgi:vitamin B12 transporter
VAGRDGAGLSELIVTATRSPQLAERIGQQVTVINAQTLRQRQAVVVSDLLATTPGVSFSRNGGVGGLTSLRIRGAETDQTLVVVDGVKLNDPSTTGGGYNFANALIGDVARIEILRGAQSTLWGSQAIGGVVSIVTVEPSKPLEGHATVEGGSFGTGYARAGVGGTTDRVVWRLAAARYVTDGVSAYAPGAEKDGYRNTGASGRVRVNLTGDVSVDLRGVYSKGRNEFDGFPPPTFSFGDTREHGTAEELVGYGGLNFALFDGALQNRVAYGYTRTDRDNFNPNQAVTTKTFDARGENRRWEDQGAWAITEVWNATFGAESEHSKMRTASPSAFAPNPTPGGGKTGIDSVYAQLQGEVVPGLTLTGGVRRDSHDTFGDHTLGQAAVAWALNDGNTILRASWGQGFKAPSLYNLYSEYGNLALAPEKADAWDAGIEQRFVDGKVRLSAVWFQRDTTNQIDFVSCSATAAGLCVVNGVRRFGYYDNVAQAKAHGVELAASGKFGDLDLSANYTWTDTENDSPGNVNRGKRLARRPQYQANLSADYVWPVGLSTGAQVRYVGDSYDTAANAYVLQSYTLVDLRAAYPVNETFEVYGRIENLFDDDYETTRNYGVLGRGAYVGVRARF